VDPLDEVWGLTAGRKQLDGQQAPATLVTEVPDDEAHTLWSDLRGVGMGRARRPTLTHQVAEGLTVLEVAPSRQEMAQRSASGAAGSRRRPVLVLGIEGASVPTRPDRARGRRPGQGRYRAKRGRGQGQWRDAKGVRFSLMDGNWSVPLISGPQGQHERERGEARQQVNKVGVIPEDQGRLWVVADGAPWRWQHVKALCPHARHVLDSDHGADALPDVAKAHYGSALQALEGAEATMTRLDWGKGLSVLGGLRRRQAQSDAAAQAIAQGWDALDAHRERTDYRKFRRGG